MMLRSWLRPPLIWDVLVSIGLVFVAIGLWLIFPPAAWIVVGIALISLGLVGASKWTGEREKKSSTRRLMR